MRVSIEIHLSGQLQCPFAAAYMKLVNSREIGRRQFIEIFACAPQTLRDYIGQCEAFAVVACYAVGHRR
jgi:hypothetical protein